MSEEPQVQVEGHTYKTLKELIDERKGREREQQRAAQYLTTRDEVIKIAALGATADSTDEMSKRRFEKIWRLMSSLT